MSEARQTSRASGANILTRNYWIIAKLQPHGFLAASCESRGVVKKEFGSTKKRKVEVLDFCLPLLVEFGRPGFFQCVVWTDVVSLAVLCLCLLQCVEISVLHPVHQSLCKSMRSILILATPQCEGVEMLLVCLCGLRHLRLPDRHLGFFMGQGLSLVQLARCERSIEGTSFRLPSRTTSKNSS